MLVVFLLIVVAVCASPRADVIQCRNSDECGQGKCCVIGQSQYSLPSCQKLIATGGGCRPDSGASTFPVSYPGVQETNITAFVNLCPCDKGNSCERGVCVKTAA